MSAIMTSSALALGAFRAAARPKANTTTTHRAPPTHETALACAVPLRIAAARRCAQTADRGPQTARGAMLFGTPTPSVAPTVLAAIRNATPSVVRWVPACATSLARIGALWAVACLLVGIDAYTLRREGRVRRGLRNGLVFVINVIDALAFDAAGCLLLWTAIHLATLPIALLWRDLRRDPEKYVSVHADAATAHTLNEFVQFLALLEWAAHIYMVRAAIIKFGVPFQTTLVRVGEYCDYVMGNAPDAPAVVVGRMIGAHEVVRVDPGAANARRRRGA